MTLNNLWPREAPVPQQVGLLLGEKHQFLGREILVPQRLDGSPHETDRGIQLVCVCPKAYGTLNIMRHLRITTGKRSYQD